eukprot:304834-Rhodomonas_salina.5
MRCPALKHLCCNQVIQACTVHGIMVVLNNHNSEVLSYALATTCPILASRRLQPDQYGPTRDVGTETGGAATRLAGAVMLIVRKGFGLPQRYLPDAMPGTELRYAMPSTDLAYDATIPMQFPVLTERTLLPVLNTAVDRGAH